ncbi:pilus assembly protein TadG-related protein [Nocardiopsis sp. NPDC049922]|uniref:pilus assembly protein TadG-related protein n=1 Tax=Nocardiopsis sp. NPDC049922 TaxID=3155157 RepID=UPI0033F64123
MNRDRLGPDDGQATAFTVVMVAAFVFCLGLVYDGGGLLRAHTQAIALAQEAARVGTRQLDWAAYRAGTDTVRLDPAAAAAAAQTFLSQSGGSGTVTVDGDTVTVTSRMSYDFVLLPLGSTTVESTASARPYTRPAP